MIFLFGISGYHGDKIGKDCMAGSGKVEMRNKESGKNDGHNVMKDGHNFQPTDKKNKGRKIRWVEIEDTAYQQNRHHEKHKAEISCFLQWVEFVVLRLSVGMWSVFEDIIGIEFCLHNHPRMYIFSPYYIM